MLCYLVNARNHAESTERSKVTPPRVEFCSVGFPRAGRVFERTITQPMVRYDPWHHRPFVHTCSHFSARVCHHCMLRETARAQQQVPQHFDGARANWSLFSQQVVLISFTFLIFKTRLLNPILKIIEKGACWSRAGHHVCSCISDHK